MSEELLRALTGKVREYSKALDEIRAQVATLTAERDGALRDRFTACSSCDAALARVKVLTEALTEIATVPEKALLGAQELQIIARAALQSEVKQ